jgi:hypothetical protein
MKGCMVFSISMEHGCRISACNDPKAEGSSVKCGRGSQCTEEFHAKGTFLYVLTEHEIQGASESEVNASKDEHPVVPIEHMHPLSAKKSTTPKATTTMSYELDKDATEEAHKLHIELKKEEHAARKIADTLSGNGFFKFFYMLACICLIFFLMCCAEASQRAQLLAAARDLTRKVSSGSLRGRGDGYTVLEPATVVAPIVQTKSPSIDIIFDNFGQDTCIRATHRPLGCKLGREVPITVRGFVDHSYGELLGIRIGYVFKSINGKDMSNSKQWVVMKVH